MMGQVAAGVIGFIEEPARRTAPALVGLDGTVVTYAELAASTKHVAQWIAGIVGPRQVVAVVAGNGPEAIPLIAGVAASTICAPLPAGQTAAERAAATRKLGASLLLLGVDDEPQDLGVPVIRVGQPSGRIDGPQCKLEPRPAILVQTSGSTGPGKLVPLTSEALSYAAAQVASTLELSPADRCLNPMPLHHTHGLVGAVLSSLAAQASVICLPRYSDLGLIDAFGQRPTWYTAVLGIHARVAALAESGRLAGHRLRFARSASAPLTIGAAKRLREALGVPVLQAYALTEAPGVVCGHGPADPVNDGSLGHARGCEVAVFDGEIAVRGPHVAPGYLSAVDGELIAHPDGWLRTGDLGELTDGELFLHGRADDVINRAGEKVYPGPVEEVIAAHPKVQDVVVFGVADPVLGEAIAALVVGDVDEQEVRRFAQESLSHGRIPDLFLGTRQIERTATGKVNRHDLAVAEIWSRVLFMSDIDPDADFTELGGGSLQAARIESLVAQRFGVELPPAAMLGEASTVRGMTTLIDKLARNVLH